MTKNKTKQSSQSAKPAGDIVGLLASAEKQHAMEMANGNYDIKLASHIVWLAIGVEKMEFDRARTENERAKIAERARKALREISWPQAVAWCRRLSDAEWARFVREVETSGEGRSVLG